VLKINSPFFSQVLNDLSVVVASDIQQPEHFAVFKVVMHKVHEPQLIDFYWHCQRLRLLANQTFARFDSDVQR
jgi:hypothetical protein